MTSTPLTEAIEVSNRHLKGEATAEEARVAMAIAHDWLNDVDAADDSVLHTIDKLLGAAALPAPMRWVNRAVFWISALFGFVVGACAMLLWMILKFITWPFRLVLGWFKPKSAIDWSDPDIRRAVLNAKFASLRTSKSGD